MIHKYKGFIPYIEENPTDSSENTDEDDFCINGKEGDLYIEIEVNKLEDLTNLPYIKRVVTPPKDVSGLIPIDVMYYGVFNKRIVSFYIKEVIYEVEDLSLNQVSVKTSFLAINAENNETFIYPLDVYPTLNLTDLFSNEDFSFVHSVKGNEQPLIGEVHICALMYLHSFMGVTLSGIRLVIDKDIDDKDLLNLPFISDMLDIYHKEKRPISLLLPLTNPFNLNYLKLFKGKVADNRLETIPNVNFFYLNRDDKIERVYLKSIYTYILIINTEEIEITTKLDFRDKEDNCIDSSLLLYIEHEHLSEYKVNTTSFNYPLKYKQE